MQDKNRADIALVVDSLELAFTKDYVDTYVIVSGDSDFTPLVLKLRELDKRVIGCGVRSSTSRLLVHACDEFIFYDSIVNTRKRRERNRPRTKHAQDSPAEVVAAFHLLQDAVEGLQKEIPDPPLAGVVKSSIQRRSPDFSETDFGFSSFGRFLEAAQKAGHVRLSRAEKSGGYRVDLIESQAENSSQSSSSNSKSQSSNAEMRFWLDPYLPEGSDVIVRKLDEEGVNPLSAPSRKAILDALEESVKSRKSRKRRINAHFIQEDVRRRMRKTHPELPPKAIRYVFNSLMRAGVLLHKDGSPVRTGSAPFQLTKNSTELNDALADVYLDTLHHASFDLSNIKLLAELFHGDPDNTRRIEETIAYLQAHTQEDIDEDDMDALLSVDPETKEVSKKEASSSDSNSKQDAASASAELEQDQDTDEVEKPTTPAVDASEEAPVEAQESEASEKKTAKKSPSRKRTSKAKAAKDEAKEGEAVETKAKAKAKAKAKPKKKTTRTRKKPAADAEVSAEAK